MTNGHSEHDALIGALDRLGDEDRAAMPASLRGRLETTGAARSRPVLARLAPLALVAAALGAVAVPLFVGGGSHEAPSADVVAELDDAFDASWFLGDEAAALDLQLEDLARSLDNSNENALTLDMIGEDL